MNDTQILSTFQELALPPDTVRAGPVLVFDACQIGVVLRAVLFVELVVGVGVMFAARGFVDWMVEFALITGAALPATLAWLITACMAKLWLGRLALPLQCTVAVLLGAVAGAYGCGMLTVAGLLVDAPWWASAMGGALLSAVLVAGLVLRAKGRGPADTSARLAELQSRIRPHFLFNTLNSAIALVRAEPAKAEALLEDLSDLFRYVLVDAGPTATLADEIALAQRYLAIEQVRFGERLKLHWSLDPRANAAKLPPLLLQPLVENAVHHGVEPSAQGAEVHVSTQVRGSVVVIKVTNTVPAGQGNKGQGIALRNVRDRLGLMHDVQGQFRSGLKSGTYQVRIEVPL
ncbi:MAG: sensor histidine kinase [Burkholderiales bacterium PBB4]|nr:MAG: sensor histidine kinase [Burkholderiales bacterium PBB4]